MAAEITDRQRRDVAHKLRALDMSDIDVDGCIIDSTKYIGLLLMRMLDVACDYRDGLHYFPGFFSAQAVVELFADLIDLTTCNDVGDNWKFRCSVCGCELDILEMEVGEPTMWKDGAAKVPNYCPSCGAEVVMTSD